MKNYILKRKAKRLFYHLFTFSFACVMIYPLVWMIMGSFKDTTEIFRHAEHLFPQKFHLGNYILWEQCVLLQLSHMDLQDASLEEKEYGLVQC